MRLWSTVVKALPYEVKASTAELMERVTDSSMTKIDAGYFKQVKREKNEFFLNYAGLIKCFSYSSFPRIT